MQCTPACRRALDHLLAENEEMEKMQQVLLDKLALMEEVVPLEQAEIQKNRQTLVEENERLRMQLTRLSSSMAKEQRHGLDEEVMAILANAQSAQLRLRQKYALQSLAKIAKYQKRWWLGEHFQVWSLRSTLLMHRMKMEDSKENMRIITKVFYTWKSKMYKIQFQKRSMKAYALCDQMIAATQLYNHAKSIYAKRLRRRFYQWKINSSAKNENK